MYCVVCGAQIQAGQNDCTACGKPLGEGAAGPRPGRPGRPGRVDRHVRLLAIFWLVISGLLLIPGLALLTVGTIGLPFIPQHFPVFVFPFGLAIAGFFLACGIAGFAAGWGLLERRPWARPLALVLGIISLVHVPFGTALGIYTLWVLLPSESDQEYRRLAKAA